jgi:hypothetical protein
VWFYDTDSASEVFVSGNYAYVTDATVFRVMDVSNPGKPFEIGLYDTKSYIDQVFVSGNYAYIGVEDSIKIIDISDPKHPTEVGFYDTPSEAKDICVSNGYAYVAGRESGLYILKLTIPISCLKGDVNGDGSIKSNDAILALRISAGLITPTVEQICSADMNNDGSVKANDAILILRKVAGLEAPPKNLIADRNISVSFLVSPSNEEGTKSEAHGLKGETITVPITVDNIDILSSGDMSISYDSKVLRAIDVLSSDGLLMADNVSQPGLIRISFAGVDRLDDGKLAEIKFEVLTDDVSPLTFKIAELYGTDALPLNSKFTNKQFRSWAVAPERSALLQNYPNPFNPETWIPYQLHESGEVVIRIHNVTGELVRELRLGYKPAGIYTNQDRSAYWDGRNEAGERVSSGVYFYNIQAGNYNAIMKMIISK